MLNSVQQQIVDGVEQNGWFTVNYVPGPNDPPEYFTYTVGLTKTAGWPEIICFGLDPERTFGMLRDTIAECWEREIRPADGVELNKVLKDLPARLQRVDDLTTPYFAMADWYAEHSGTPRTAERLQLLWPDPEGRFPGDPKCGAYARDKQTPKAAK